MELRDYIRILRKSWVLIVLCTLVAVGAASAYSILQTPQYSATSKVFVSTQSSGSTADLAQGNNFSVARVKTYSALVTTPIVLLPVIASQGLAVPADALAEKVVASAQLDTSIIEITVTDTDPVRAADTANAVSASLTLVVEDIETPDTADAASPVKLTRAQEASVATVPVSPNVPLNIALGALVGLALGVGIAVLRETLETRIRNTRDVEQLTDLPILGGIVFDPKANDRPLIVHVDPRSPRAESFRTLRTNLQFLDVGRVERSFVITSSIESEGKSTTGANLAIALADAGSRVLLVDADLRRPKVADYMDIEGAVGLTDVLIGRADLADVIQPWGKGQLFVLPAGHVPPNPSELLGSTRMTQLIVEFNRAFDVVLFDAPPLLPVTDAAVLAKNVGGALVVVAAGRTHKNQLTGAIAALGNVGAPISGLVLTMLPTSGPDAYGYGHYGYGYSYGETDPVAPASIPTADAAPARARGARVKP
ncbi:polysaccharide biosynthesis tyrosine autokinase [Cryobacterium sp. TMT1-3]|uniref:polysaccharide biosynthesis tyrosine autokinase n=1 Tax=Cryobacterium sp. TMT1-3 TaxID=1259237 RepID=UPI00106CDB95|nr:polysaccharide biosynthesis tyrosine autokinase [Cryobacterium sp. TMT1-3]TFC24401.1 polysaccharide biosynthesis tyrosine autokinase [Cryobacterium sp. TMT1-3]